MNWIDWTIMGFALFGFVVFGLCVLEGLCTMWRADSGEGEE